MYDEFFAKAHELMQKGEPFVTATVVRAERPTSSKPGDKAIVTIHGVMHGWIGGSCAQPTVIQESLRALADDESRLIRLSTDPEGQTVRQGLQEMEMTCFSGGTLEIYIEPQRPRPRLMIIGNLPVAQALAHLGKAMNYHVIAVDPDHKGAGMAHADQLITELDQIAHHITPFTYLVIATHGNYDETALSYALKTKAPYIGLIASKRRATAVRDYLDLQGFDENDLLAFKAPAGLNIQARRGDEIALSIMAEIVQKRRNAELLDIELLRGANLQPQAKPSPQAKKEEQAETAVDPICQMTVTIATAKHVYEYEGENYYFCCGGCLTKFVKQKQSVP